MSAKAPLLYRLLLLLLPPQFRRDFGKDLEAVLVARLRDAPGAAARAWIWLIAVVDVLVSAPSEWAHALGHQRTGNAPRSNAVDHLKLDLRFALRSLARRPGFTAIAVITLALGIGANTAIFSLIHAVLLRPLPFAEPERLVSVWERRADSNNANTPVSAHEFVALRERSRTFEQAALYQMAAVNLTGGGEAQSASVRRTTSEYFDVLGVQPLLGRAFLPGEDQAGRNRVIVLSHQLWQQRFGGDATVLDKIITLDDESHTIVGVMPPMSTTLGPDLYVPINLPLATQRVGLHNLNVIARLMPGVTLGEAQADLSRIARELATEMPRENTGHQVAAIRIRDDLVGDVRQSLLVLLGAVGFVLLIACANVASLMLVRAGARKREIGVRAALGASRARLIRQLLTESVLLAALGGAVGMLVALWSTRLFPSVAAVNIPLLDRVAVDGSVLAAAAALSLLTGILTGIAPAFRGSGVALSRSLTDGGRVSAERGAHRLGTVLIAAEVALALILLVGAGLLIRSFASLVRVDPGFRTDNVAVMSVSLPGPRYPTPESSRQFFDRLFERLDALPGVVSAGGSSQLPLLPAENRMPYRVEGRPQAEPGQESSAPFRVIAPGYFRTLGIPLSRGRSFRSADARIAVPMIRWSEQQPYPPRFDEPQPQPVAIVSEAFAREHWPNDDPIGKRLRLLFSPWLTVVGIVGDVKHGSLDAPAYGHIYVPYVQEPWGNQDIVVRTHGDPAQMAAALREQVRALDTDLPVTATTVDALVSGSVGQPRLYAFLTVAFGAVALALTLVGIFGVASYAVAQRVHEIGVRMALGAQRSDILRLAIGQAVLPAVLGVIAGIAGALALAQLIEHLLFGVTPRDPATFAAVCLLVIGAALLAAWLPARRAARVDPVWALRD